MSDENSMNVDDEGLTSRNDRDIDMESNASGLGWVNEAGVNEEGWFVTAPTMATSLAINDSEPEDTSMSTSAVPLRLDALVIQQVNDPTTSTINITSAARLPVTTRFSEMLNTSDEQMLQVLKGTLGKQLEQVTRDAKPRIVENANLQRGALSHGSTSQLSRADPSSGISVPTDRHQIAIVSSETQSGASGHTSTAIPADFPADPVPHEEHKDAPNVNVPYSDFQSFIRSFERLSANVQVLIEQGGSSNPNSNPGGPGPGPAKRPDTHQSYITGRFLFEGNDEREEASVRVYKKRPFKENSLHKILRDLLVEYGLRISKRQKIFALKDSAPKAVVDAYLVGRGDGPTLDNLRLDWTEPMTSPWNSSAIFILTTLVLERLKNDHYTELKYEDWMTDERIFLELKEKLTVSKEEYDNTIDSNAHDSDINAAESRARYASRKLQKKIRNRRNMRRRTLYNCRLKTICENLGTHPAWESALQLMYVLGDNAMSDDETDVERSTRRKKVVRRVETPWACVQLKNMINTIDLYYSRFFWDGFQKPGPGPRDRLTTIFSESPRPAPRSLPENCYNNMYINSLTPYQRSLLRCKRNMEIPALPLPPA